MSKIRSVFNYFNVLSWIARSNAHNTLTHQPLARGWGRRVPQAVNQRQAWKRRRRGASKK